MTNSNLDRIAVVSNCQSQVDEMTNSNLDGLIIDAKLGAQVTTRDDAVVVEITTGSRNQMHVIVGAITKEPKVPEDYCEASPENMILALLFLFWAFLIRCLAKSKAADAFCDSAIDLLCDVKNIGDKPVRAVLELLV